MKLLCIVQLWWIHVIIHLSELIEQVNPKQAERLGAMGVSLLRKGTNPSLRSKCQYLGRAVCNQAGAHKSLLS